jgi:hypothetical protein
MRKNLVRQLPFVLPPVPHAHARELRRHKRSARPNERGSCRDLQGRWCGNGVREPDRSESCDGAAPGLGCLEAGYLFGTASCTPDCKIDTDQCAVWCGFELVPGSGIKAVGAVPMQFVCRARR